MHPHLQEYAVNRLSDDYYKRAVFRVEILRVIFERGGYSDTVREAQEAVELFLKGLLRKVGVDPPRWHDVSKALLEYENLFSPETRANLPRICALSAGLRKEREISFYGEEDFLPSESYSREDAEGWLVEVEWLSRTLAAEFSRDKN